MPDRLQAPAGSTSAALEERPASRARTGGRGAALVTNATDPLAAAIACVLAAEGWDVGLEHPHEPDARELVGEVTRAGAAVEVAESVERDFAFLEERLGRVRALVHVVDGSASDPVRELLPSVSRALTSMRRERFGRIVFVTPPADLGSLLAPGESAAGAYLESAGRAGLVRVAKVLAVDVARAGITVNSVVPGVLAVDPQRPPSRELERLIPARRLATCDEVAATVGFLASEEAAYVTGCSLAVDGGLSA